MISPISSTSLYSKNLEPVKVPHFSGKNSLTYERAQINSKTKDSVTFKKHENVILDSAKKSGIKILGTIKTAGAKAVSFIKEFTKSIFEDAQGIVGKSFKNKLVKADKIIDNVTNKLS